MLLDIIIENILLESVQLNLNFKQEIQLKRVKEYIADPKMFI